MCCSSGKVKLPALEPPPEPLESLMSGTTPRSKHFLENIRKYNSCFQMTSFGANNAVCEPGFMPTFKVQGQIYFMGNERLEARQRCNNIPGDCHRWQRLRPTRRCLEEEEQPAVKMATTSSFQILTQPHECQSIGGKYQL